MSNTCSCLTDVVSINPCTHSTSLAAFRLPIYFWLYKPAHRLCEFDLPSRSRECLTMSLATAGWVSLQLRTATFWHFEMGWDEKVIIECSIVAQRSQRDLDTNFISVICEVSFLTFSQRISGKGQRAEVSTSASGQGGCGLDSGSDRAE